MRIKFMAVICLAVLSASAYAGTDTPDETPLPAHAVTSHASARAAAKASEEGQPLLPEPPRHGYVPMAPLIPGSTAGAQGAAEDVVAASPPGHMPEYAGQLPASMEMLALYGERISHMLRRLMLAACAALALLLAGVIYLRAIARGTLRAARMAADAADRQAEQGRDMAAKQLRAYVFTNGAKGEMLPGKGFIVRIEVKNFGNTPACRVNGWMGVYVDALENERVPGMMPQDFQAVETILPPGGVCYYYAQTRYAITPEIKAIASGQKAIFAYGEIRYSDVFGQSHYVRFKIKCTGERNLASGSFDHCVVGNESE